MTNADDLRRLSDVPVMVQAELGRRMLTLREIAGLKPGAVVATAKPAGEQVDLYVGNVRVAAGEVICGESLALRITALAAPD